MIKKLVNSFISLIFVLYANNISSEDLIPAEFFACYSNSNSMEMSPDGKYIAIVSQPRALGWLTIAIYFPSGDISIELLFE